MKHINDILKEFGLEIPEDKKADFEKAVLENYKTVAEVESLQTKLSNAETANKDLKEKYDTDIGTRDNDLKDLQKKLKDAQAAGVDTEKFTELETELKNLRSAYDTDKKAYEEQLAKQAHEFLVREAAGSIKFTSNSAKKAFIADALAEETICNKDGKLTGFDDFLNNYKETDADAFVADEPDQNQPPQTPPDFSSKSGSTSNPEPESFEHPLVL